MYIYIHIYIYIYVTLNIMSHEESYMPKNNSIIFLINPNVYFTKIEFCHYFSNLYNLSSYCFCNNFMYVVLLLIDYQVAAWPHSLDLP